MIPKVIQQLCLEILCKAEKERDEVAENEAKCGIDYDNLWSHKFDKGET